MLVATIVTYNDMPLIKDCIESVRNKVDRIVVVDGKYRDFPGEENYSTDGTLEYLSGLNIEILFSYGLDEVEKRNCYLNELKDGDICLNIDSDEMLVGDIPELTTDIGVVHIGEWGDRRRHRRTNRFFKYHKGMYYWGTHKMILDRGKLFANLDRVGNYSFKETGMEFLHNNHLRSPERKKDKKKYYEILVRREARINEPAN